MKKRKRSRKGPCPETAKARAQRAAAFARVIGTGIGLIRNGELAAILGVTRQTLHAWRRDHLIPDPDVHVGTIAGWSGDAVRAMLSPKPAA